MRRFDLLDAWPPRRCRWPRRARRPLVTRRKVLASDAVEAGLELAPQHPVGAVGSCARSSFSPTHSTGRRVALQGGLGPCLPHPVVGLAEDVPPLAVADEHPVGADLAQHHAGDLAGERPAVLVVHVLGAHAERRALRDRGDVRDVDRGREHRHFSIVTVAEPTLDRLDQVQGLGPVQIHFPVARDVGLATGRHVVFASAWLWSAAIWTVVSDGSGCAMRLPVRGIQRRISAISSRKSLSSSAWGPSLWSNAVGIARDQPSREGLICHRR